MLGSLVSVVYNTVDLCLTTAVSFLHTLHWVASDLILDVVETVSSIVTAAVSALSTAVEVLHGVMESLLTSLANINTFLTAVFDKFMAASNILFVISDLVKAAFNGAFSLAMQCGVAVMSLVKITTWLTQTVVAHVFSLRDSVFYVTSFSLSIISDLITTLLPLSGEQKHDSFHRGSTSDRGFRLWSIVTTPLLVILIVLTLSSLAILLCCMYGGIRLLRVYWHLQHLVMPTAGRGEREGGRRQNVAGDGGIQRPGDGCRLSGVRQELQVGRRGSDISLNGRQGLVAVPRQRNIQSQPDTSIITPATQSPSLPPSSHPPLSPQASAATPQGVGADNADHNRLCIVCMDNERSVLLRPCRHYCVCEECSHRLRGECPICRRNITSTEVVHIYYD